MPHARRRLIALALSFLISALIAGAPAATVGARPPSPATSPSDLAQPSAFKSVPPAPRFPDALLPLRAAAPEQATSLCPVGDGGDPFAVVDAFFEQELNRQGFPGAAIAIALDGAIVHERGFGVKHLKDGGTVDAQTQFRFGSALKMMTAAAVLQQVEAGRVTLDQPVRTYVPEFQLADPALSRQVTVWNLLTHSTGIPDSYGDMDLNGPKSTEALSDWAASMGKMKFFAPPGSFWNYSNPNFSLAGLVAERASGTDYHTLMAENIFARAGMTSTTLLPANVLSRGNYTYGHSFQVPGTAPIYYAPDAYDNWVIAPAGLGFTTVGDLVRWASLLMAGGGDVLSPESAAALQSSQIGQGTIPGVGYGYGVMVEPYGELTLRHHGGNVNGWGALVLWIPERDFAVATLNNADGNISLPILCAIEAVLGVPIPATLDYSTDPATWGRYAGEYHVVDDFFVRYGLADSNEFEAEVIHSGSQLRLNMPAVRDVISPTVSFSRTLVQMALNTFMMDLDLNGRPDSAWAITFLDDPDSDAVRWFRHRYFVGTRRSEAPLPALLPTLYVP